VGGTGARGCGYSPGKGVGTPSSRDEIHIAQSGRCLDLLLKRGVRFIIFLDL
jgi:hypothetical protein